MTGSLTPKRPLEVDEDDSQSKYNRWNLKRHEHDVLAGCVSASRLLSPSSYGRASSVKTLGDEVQRLVVGSSERDVEPSQRNGCPPLSCPQNTSDIHLPRASPRFSTVDTRSQKLDAQEDIEICFGMLRDIQIRSIGTQNKELKVLEEIGRDKDTFEYSYLELIFGQDRCNIHFNGINIATMNTKTHYALKALSEEKVRYEALVTRADFKQNLNTAIRPLGVDISKLAWLMNIQVFGVRSIADTVAKKLSQYRLFLQHPRPMPLDVAYENPQYLSMVASSFTNGAVLPPISVEASQGEVESNLRSEELDFVLDEVIAVINDLPGHDYLRQEDVDKGIKTNLLIHQKIGFDFVMSRELNENTSPRTLWHVDDATLGISVFQHKITGLRSKAPDDILGGILADDMGLGKTLTMIATIVTTISRAAHFASLSDKMTNAAKIPVISTLVIVPSVSLLKVWIDEIEKHVFPGILEPYIYHGPKRCLVSSSPLPYQIVLSTYGTVAADFSRGGGVLNYFHWYRLILDEAHTVRNWTTKSFKAVKSLSANIRWCMTGTPVQNSLNDLRSLVQFLRVPHLEDTAVFQRRITGKQRRVKDIQTPKPDYENLRMLLGSVCLRRSISSLSLSLGFTCLYNYPQLSKTERRAYNDLAMSCKRSIDAAVNNRRALRGSSAILTALLRLRMFCNTGLINIGVMEKDSIKQYNLDEINSLYQQSGEAFCVECGSEILSFDINHSLDQHVGDLYRRLKCQECIPQAPPSQDGGYSLRGHLSPAQNIENQHKLQHKEDSRDECGSDSFGSTLDPSAYPSKLKALLSDILEHCSQEKSIVFSFWRRSLNLVARMLRKNNIIFGQVDGTLSPHQRQEVLAEFHHDPSIKVLLMTLGTGAAGLNNLSVASRVHILEPQWNPAIEDQAIGRVLRLGQDKNVCIIRYIMTATIEESVKSRQFVKVQLALAGGLQSSGMKKSSDHQRTTRLQELGRIIEQSILTESLTTVSQKLS